MVRSVSDAENVRLMLGAVSAPKLMNPCGPENMGTKERIGK